MTIQSSGELRADHVLKAGHAPPPVCGNKSKLGHQFSCEK